MDDRKKDRVCQPIMNGFVCPISNHSLNNLRKDMGLYAVVDKSPNRSKVILTDKSGEWIGTAVKNGESDIKLFSNKSLL